MNLDDAIEFLGEAADVEFRARRAVKVERDTKKMWKAIREYDAMFTGDLRSGLSRPDRVPDRYWSSHAESAEALQPRTLFAVARYGQGATVVFRAWRGDTELGARGEALLENFYARPTPDGLKILAHYDVCRTCGGKLRLPDRRTCPDCKGTGWEHSAGEKIKKLGKLVELRRLTAPTDPLSKPLWDAIPRSQEAP